MDINQLIEKLCDLVQLDIDATFAYEQALNNIDDEVIYNTISKFRDDHLRHINELSNAIIQNSGKPPKIEKDFKGFIIEGFTSLRSITGTVGALKAMQSNEELTNKTYKNALLENDMPENIKSIIEKNYDDEKRHLKYIQNTLKSYQK